MTFDAMITEVRRLAEESPDALYKGPPSIYGNVCSYTQGECGKGVGCILGQAAKNVWPELFEEMKKYDQIGICGIPFFENEPMLAYFRLIDNRPQLFWLKTVQNYQDDDAIPTTWRGAVLIADTYHPLP